MGKGPIVEIDFSQVLRNRYGKPLTEYVDEGGEDDEPEKKTVTLGYVSVNALYHFDPEKRVKGIVKARKHELAQRIIKALDDEDDRAWVQMQTTEAALIKELIGDVMPTLHAGQAWDMIESGRSTKKDEKACSPAVGSR